MDPDHTNRMATPRKRGRPSNAELAARQPAEPVEEREIEMSVYQVALCCPHCRRFMSPRIEGGRGFSRYAVMPCCTKRVRIDYDHNGKPQSIQLI